MGLKLRQLRALNFFRSRNLSVAIDLLLKGASIGNVLRVEVRKAQENQKDTTTRHS